MSEGDRGSASSLVRELARERDHYRLIAENAGDYVIHTDADGVITWAAPSATEVIGWRSDELVGRHTTDLIDEATRDEAAESIRAAMGGATVRSRTLVRCADGSRKWIAFVLRSVVDERGAVVGRVSTAWDIDDQVEAEKALAEREALLRATTDASLDPHVLLRAVRDESGAIVDFAYADANDAACAYNRVPREQLLGATLLELLPAHKGTGLLDDYIHVVESGEPLVLNDYEYPHDIFAEPRRFDVRAVRVGDAISYTWRDVTDRHASGVAVAASEARFRLLAENSGDFIVTATLDGVIDWVSPTVTGVLGWQPSDMLGRTSSDFVHVDDLRRFRDSLAPVEHGSESHERFRMRHADGSYRWLAGTVRRLVGPDGSTMGRVSSWRDVQAQVETESALRSEQERLAAVLNSEIEPHVYLQAVRDAAGRIVDFIYRDVNAAACDYMQMTREQLEGARVLDLLPGQAGSGMLAMYAVAVESGQPLVLDDYAYPHEVLAGERRYDIRGVRVGDGLSFAWRDVTERHRMQSERAASEARFRYLAENAGETVAELDLEGTLGYVSPAVLPLLGWQPSELAGTPLFDLIHPDDLPNVVHGQELSHRAPDGIGTARARLRCRDGSFRWIGGTVREVRDSEGTPLGAVAVLRNIQPEIKAEEALALRARTDTLTGLLNRSEIVARLDSILAHPQRAGQQLALLFIDLDGLKPINDTRGHSAGDLLLTTTADRVSEIVRDDDLVARIGGDEMLVLLTGVRDVNDATAVAEKIRRAIAQPVRTPDEAPITSTASIGVTIAHPGDDVSSLITRADSAMYTAKHRGRDRVTTIT